MKLHAKEVPYSSIVGSSVMLQKNDENGEVVCILPISVPNPGYDYKAVANEVMKVIIEAFNGKVKQ